mgnify:CR=1 FL=1
MNDFGREDDVVDVATLGGNDWIEGDALDDAIGGSDILIGQQGMDTIFGGAGDDDIAGGHASNVLDPALTQVAGGQDVGDFIGLKIDEPADRSHLQLVLDAICRLWPVGRLRVAEPLDNGEWQVNEWVKKAVVLYFPLRRMETIEVGPFEFHDKIPLKRQYAAQGVRVVPHPFADHHRLIPGELDFGDEVGLVGYGQYAVQQLSFYDGEVNIDVSDDPITSSYYTIDSIQRWTGMNRTASASAQVSAGTNGSAIR